jgi:hypothetical protein
MLSEIVMDISNLYGNFVDDKNFYVVSQPVVIVMAALPKACPT